MERKSEMAGWWPSKCPPDTQIFLEAYNLKPVRLRGAALPVGERTCQLIFSRGRVLLCNQCVLQIGVKSSNVKLAVFLTIFQYLASN